MSEAAVPAVGGNPFTARTALALVLFGSLMFVALLWMIGNGLADGDSNNGGGHAEGRGLNGYAALSDLLERSGYQVRHSRDKAAFREPGLLVLTPVNEAAAKDIEAAVDRHRAHGPVLLVLPKWMAFAVPSQLRATTKAKAGWTMLMGTTSPTWADALSTFDKLDVRIDGDDGSGVSKRSRAQGAWHGFERTGVLPDKTPIQTLSAGSVESLVWDRRGQTLAGFLNDGSAPPKLNGMEYPVETSLYPVVIVAEPDLLDNYGMADRQRAMLALAMIAATQDDGEKAVTFDLTLAGLERETGLLTLAFSPPFLAATLCLLLAAGVVGWRAFLRFGPPLAPVRAIAFGKRALVANAAGLIVRSRRYHLLGQPYAEAARSRLVHAFALPRDRGRAADLYALDRAARAVSADDHAFSQAADRLAHARTERELVKAAADLHALERTLTR